MEISWIAPAAACAACALFAAGAATDLRSRTVPNAIPLALFALFALHAVADPMSPGASPWAHLAVGAAVLAPVSGRPPFVVSTEASRKVAKDCVIQWDSNFYSVPWQLVGCQVRVEIVKDELRVYYGAELQATHARCRQRHQRRVDPAHYKGLQRTTPTPTAPSSLSRPLDEYAQVAGGTF